MKKTINSFHWAVMAGIIVIVVFLAERSSSWLSKEIPKSTTKGMSVTEHKPNFDKSLMIAVKKSDPGAGKNKLEVAHGNADPLTVDPEKIYLALMSLESGQINQALETASRFPEVLYAIDAIYKRIVELCSSEDKEVSKKAWFARSRFLEMRAVHEIPEPPITEVSEAEQHGSGMIETSDTLEARLEPLESLQVRALDDPDPSVRLGGIEGAMSQSDENIYGVLSEAARSDSEPDNRLSAIGEVEQMLKSGLGDREQILNLLRETSMDADPRVAELSQLIIEEQFGPSNSGDQAAP